MSVHLRPEEIEAESFRIIDAEVGPHAWPATEWPVVRRVIHTSADFDYARTMVFSPDAVSGGLAALRSGRGIVTDTTMALAGINKGLLERFGLAVSCFVADPTVSAEAPRLGITRSILTMRRLPAIPATGFLSSATPLRLFSNCCDWYVKKDYGRTWWLDCRSDSSELKKARKNCCGKPPGTPFPSSPTVAGRAVPTWQQPW